MFINTLLNALPGVVAQGLIWSIMAIGVYITYKILDVADLTVDGTMCTGGAVFIMLVTGGWNPWPALVAAFLAGMAAGLVTGLLHTACGIPAILAGILTQLALYSVNLRIMGQSNRPISVDKYPLLVSARNVREAALSNPIAGILTQLALYSVNLRIMGQSNRPISVDKYPLLVSARNVREAALSNPILVCVLFTAATIGALYWFFGTEQGCAVRATGANPNMARAQGINTNFTTVLGLMLSNGLVALSAALLAQYQGFADVNSGRGAIVIGLAAVIIGEVLFSKVFRNFALKLLAVVFGSLIYYLVYQVVILLGLKSDDMKLITALIVALFLAVPYWKGRYFTKRTGKGAGSHA